MPIYEYRCQACGHITEALIRAQREIGGVRCEECGSRRLERVYLSAIAPLRAAEAGEPTPCCGEREGCSEPKRCCERYPTETDA